MDCEGSPAWKDPTPCGTVLLLGAMEVLGLVLLAGEQTALVGSLKTPKSTVTVSRVAVPCVKNHRPSAPASLALVFTFPPTCTTKVKSLKGHCMSLTPVPPPLNGHECPAACVVSRSDHPACPPVVVVSVRFRVSRRQPWAPHQ